MSLFIAIGIGGSALIYIAIMQSLGWPIQTGSNVFASMNAGGGSSLILYRAPHTQKYFQSVGGKYDVLLEPWRVYAKDKGLSLNEIDTLGPDGPNLGSVLVLASAVSLDSAERESLIRYKNKGGSLIVTWAAGSRDAQGKWAGWDLIQQLGDTKVVADLPSDGSLTHLVTKGQGPLTHAMPAGLRMPFGKTSEVPLLLAGADVAAHVMNADRLSSSADLQRGLLVYKEKSNGSSLPSSRVVVLGISESGWESQKFGMYSLLDGALGWLSRQPVVLQANWPNAVDAAFLVAVDVADKFENADKLAAKFGQENYSGSFFLRTAEAKKFPDIVRRMDGKHDVGYHGDVAAEFKGNPAALQKSRVSSMLLDLNQALNQSGVKSGFHAPSELFDANTHQALFDAGIRYHLTGSQATDSRLPFMAPVEGQKPDRRLVVMPRTQRDDLALLRDTQGDISKLEQAVLDDLNTVVSHGGLGVLSLNSAQFDESLSMQATVTSLISHVRSQPQRIWLTNGRGVAEWWLGKERFLVNSRLTGSRIELDLTILGNRPYEHGTLIVILPDKSTLPQVRGLKPGMPVPRVEKLDEYRAVLRFDALQPDSYSYSLTF